ncbi:hypothetical protein VTJ04DRAFT_9460 [Mycothermus thermophilus]|uniref:uncharacterized protein n=1 Tax=Humicola insolens TaxID=85995 RepID=UPI003742EB34
MKKPWSKACCTYDIYDINSLKISQTCAKILVVYSHDPGIKSQSPCSASLPSSYSIFIYSASIQQIYDSDQASPPRNHCQAQ